MSHDLIVEFDWFVSCFEGCDWWIDLTSVSGLLDSDQPPHPLQPSQFKRRRGELTSRLLNGAQGETKLGGGHETGGGDLHDYSPLALMASLPASPSGCVFFRVTVGVTQRSTGTEAEIDKRGANYPCSSWGDVGISGLN